MIRHLEMLIRTHRNTKPMDVLKKPMFLDTALSVMGALHKRRLVHPNIATGTILGETGPGSN